MGRRHNRAETPISLGQQLADPLRRPPALPDLEERTDDAAHHLR
jgi:hypothetical protein